MRAHIDIGDVAGSGFRSVATLLVQAVNEIVREAGTGHKMKLPKQRGTKEGRGNLASHQLPDTYVAPSKKEALKELVDYAMAPSRSRDGMGTGANAVTIVSNTRGTGKSDLIDRLGVAIESEFASQTSPHFKVCNVLVITMNGHMTAYGPGGEPLPHAVLSRLVVNYLVADKFHTDGKSLASIKTATAKAERCARRVGDAG